ncbi:hypothetical protein [Mycolicibacterium sp. S2-37]|nr:hypothetical protein [Mycolicibacterium sp. S2-37]
MSRTLGRTSGTGSGSAADAALSEDNANLRRTIAPSAAGRP